MGNAFHDSFRKWAEYLEKKEIMNEREILKQSIDEHQRAIDNAKEKLVGLKVTYSQGDRFLRGNGEKYILAFLGSSCTGGSSMGIALICLRDGISYGGPADGFPYGKCHTKFTLTRLDTMLNSGNFIRYWDNRKKVYTDGRGQ